MHCVRREPCKVVVFSGCNSHPVTEGFFNKDHPVSSQFALMDIKLRYMEILSTIFRVTFFCRRS
jgi:hypothetical protein